MLPFEHHKVSVDFRRKVRFLPEGSTIIGVKEPVIRLLDEKDAL
jgi:hypothetical protein